MGVTTDGPGGMGALEPGGAGGQAGAPAAGPAEGRGTGQSAGATSGSDSGAPPGSTAPGVFLFDTTHHALWGEEVARELRVPVEVIPAPPETGAKCDLALQTPASRVEELRAAFEEEGILFRLHV